jgi:hypothetical protein
MQPRRVIVYVAQVLLLAASAVSGGTAVRHQASATTLDPVTTLHVASAPQRQAGLPAGLEPGQAGNAEQVKCQPVRTHDGESHRYWLRDDAPADDRASRASDS